METREASPSHPSRGRLDASAGRTAPSPARNRTHRRARPARAKPLAAGLLVAGLATAWLFVGRHGSSSNPLPPPPITAPAAAPADTAALRALLTDAGACADVVERTPAVRCEIDGVRLEVRLVGVTEARRIYVASSAARIAPRRGPPACARGRSDERAWSRPTRPTVAVGRYRCRIEHGAAAMWWTDEHGIVAHAVASDHDLGRLFTWWRAHRDG